MTTTLLNTLFVQTQGAYLRLKDETLVMEVEKKKVAQVPLIHLGSIVVFGNVLTSPFLLHRCAQDGRDVVWCGQSGAFRARLQGSVSGNVLLRRAQHLALTDPDKTLYLAKSFVQGKLANTRSVLQRAIRDADGTNFGLQTAFDTVEHAMKRLQVTDHNNIKDLDELRGVEGNAAAAYFQAFPQLIQNSEFSFTERNRRPPLDPVNAVLSFVYTLLKSNCESALESVGLDPQVGYLHSLRSGRPALALDLIEEFRVWWADRLVLTLFNRKQLSPQHFSKRSGGAVLLNEKGKRIVLENYQKRKQETVKHSLFKEPVLIGLLPFVQARLLARYLRGDIKLYQPFKVK